MPVCEVKYNIRVIYHQLLIEIEVKNMPKTMFDYCNFNDGHKEIEFVCHGAKYTKEEAIQLFILENDNLKMPTIEDVHQRWIRYYPKTPYFVDLDKEGGCYSYCPKNQRGSFPVWVINFESMKKT